MRHPKAIEQHKRALRASANRARAVLGRALAYVLVFLAVLGAVGAAYVPGPAPRVLVSAAVAPVCPQGGGGGPAQDGPAPRKTAPRQRRRARRPRACSCSCR